MSHTDTVRNQNVSRARPGYETRLSTNDVVESLDQNWDEIESESTNREVEEDRSDQGTGEYSALSPMSATNPPRNVWRISACVAWSFIGGFSDAAPGALLPHLEAYYNVNYAVASLIWISNAAGFILVACLSHKIQPWLGRRYSLPVGCFLSCIMYSIVSSGTVFPATVVGFFFGGAGLAVVLAQSNIFLSRLDKQSKYLAFNHGAYGTGATISPLIATGMVNAGVKWHFFYLILLGLMVCSGVSLFFAFAHADEDLSPWDVDHPSENSDEVEMNEMGASSRDPRTRRHSVSTTSQKSEMILALKNPVTWLISFFVLFYQGSEVSLAGWIVTFLLDYRHGNPASVGYVASGFWGGLTIGRLVLTRPLHKGLGARRSVILVSIGSIVLVSLVWAIPHIIAEAVLVSLAGILIGPNYPLLITYSASEGLIPRKIQIVSLTIMTAFGSSGGALFPFLVGILSQSVGTYVVLPVFLALYVVMLFLWICLPNIERRNHQGTMTFWERIW